MDRRITRDYKSEMSELLSDSKVTYCEKVTGEQRARVDVDRITLRMLTRRHGLYKIIRQLSEAKILKINRVYFADESDLFELSESQAKQDQQYFRYSPFYIFSNNFFNFSVSGSALGMKLRLKKSKELEEIEKNKPSDYQAILRSMKTPFDEDDEEVVEEIKTEEAQKARPKKVD